MPIEQPASFNLVINRKTADTQSLRAVRLLFSPFEHEDVCSFEDEFASLIVKSDCEP